MSDNKFGKFQEAIRNPAIIELLGNVKKKKILDVACVDGGGARLLYSLGAVVTAIDNNEKNIQHASSAEHSVEYLLSPLDDMSKIKKSTFDLATCFYLTEIDNLDLTFSEISRVLKKSGQFIISMPHPCFLGSLGRRIIKMKDGKLGIFVNNYFMDSLLIKSNNEPNAESKTIRLPYKISDCINALVKSGFLIERIEEPKATNPKDLLDPEIKFWSTHAARNFLIKAIKK